MCCVKIPLWTIAPAIAVMMAVLPVRSLAEAEPSPSPAPTPAVDSFVSLEDQYTPDYDQTRGGSGNSINVRAQVPFYSLFTHVLYLARIKVPFTTWAPTGAETGNGDTTLLLLAASTPKVTAIWAAGAAMRIPTASQNALGSGKWALGPAINYTYSRKPWKLGVRLLQYFSIAGPSWREPYVRTQIEPVVEYDFGDGWHVGNSEMNYKYDWYATRWTDLPVGFSVGKHFFGGLRGVDASFSAEKNLAVYKGSPSWTLSTLVKYFLST